MCWGRQGFHGGGPDQLFVGAQFGNDVLLSSFIGIGELRVIGPHWMVQV